MREAEERARTSGLNEDVMIENAAHAMFRTVEKRLKKTALTAVFVGSGNNAADGLSLARIMHLNGYRVEAVKVADSLNSYAGARLSAFAALGGKVVGLDTARVRLDCYGAVVDALFGIGLSRDLEGQYLEAVNMINESGGYKISVDIPSGINADDGSVMGAAVRADLTVTFGGYKYGHFLGEGMNYCGETVLADMGIRPETGALLTSADCPKMPARKKSSHKGDYGRVRIVGGSREMVGAPLIAAESAMTCGAGLTTLCIAESTIGAYTPRVKEATLCAVKDSDGFMRFDPEAIERMIGGADAVAIGMGMGANPELAEIISYIANRFDGVLVIDADGLNALVGRTETLKDHKCRLVLTPHRGEFKRLFGECAEKDIVSLTERVARDMNAVIVNKSALTIITDGTTTYLNVSGSPSMAKGGSGDCLAGVTAALSVRLGALKGAAKASFVCGRAGEQAAKTLGENAPLASDTVRFLKV